MTYGPPGKVDFTVAAVQKLLARFAKDESAATAIEYALIVGGISIVIGAVVHGLGSALNGRFTSILILLHQDGIVIVDSP
jgi:pilus assembly protein Flp/PilA